MKVVREPASLQEAIIYFADPDNALAYMVAKRWPDGVECPTCGSKDVLFLANQRRWKCRTNHPLRQFSAKVGTVYEDSPIPLEKWLPATWLLANDKNGISSYELGRAIQVTQRTAWFMLHRIRKAMQTTSFVKLGGPDGEVEVDETFIGGKSRNMHKSKRAQRITGTGGKDKTIVFGMLERGGNVMTMVVPDRKKETVQPIIKKHVKAGSALMTDAMVGYDGLSEHYGHEVIDHAEAYVKGRIHTNGMENFWSLVKRCLNGTYISVEPFHLFRYLDEQTFRYNQRATKWNPMNDNDRFQLVVSQLVGKRLTYAEVTGKVGETIN